MKSSGVCLPWGVSDRVNKIPNSRETARTYLCCGRVLSGRKKQQIRVSPPVSSLFR